MSGPFKRRSSLKSLPPISAPFDSPRRRSSVRNGSNGILEKTTSSSGDVHRPPSAEELPWDLLDRFLLPVILCHGAALLITTFLNALRISQVSTMTVFLGSCTVTVAAVFFYHNLKVTAAGKAVLVTGCDARLGSALVRYLDEQGFTVFAGFNDSTSSERAAELREQCSARVHILQLDVTCETQILAASLYIVEHGAGLWAVVHTSIWLTIGELEWIPPQVMKRATETNLLGPARLTQILLPLVRRSPGRIVYLTSGLANVTTVGRGLHCSLLAAIEAQAQCLRRELRSKQVDVVVVAAGELTGEEAACWTDDTSTHVQQAKDMWQQLGAEQRGEYGERYFEDAVRHLKAKYAQSQETDLGPVLRAFANAITRTYPLTRYTPVTRSEKLQAFIAHHMPMAIYDTIYS